MTKEKRLVPKLRFNKFKEKGDYNKKLFADIFIFSTGKNIKQNEASPSFETPCVRYGELYHLYNEVIDKIINKTNLKKEELLFSEGNEILLPSAGEDPLDISSASALTIENVAIGRTINILKPKKENTYSQEYVAYYINNKLKIEIAKLAKGVSISNVYNSDLKQLKINLPILYEQRKVANFLSSIDKQIQILEKKKTILGHYKKGVLQKIFKQELRFKDENGNPFPDWKKSTLDNILIEVNDKSTTSNQHAILSSTAKGLFNQSDYFNRDIASKNNAGYKIIKRYQLVFSPQNLWMGNININCDFEIGIVSPSYKIFDFNKSLTSFSFCKYLLFTNRMLYEYSQASEQGASVVRRNLDMSSFKAITIKLPTKEEQIKIANFLSTIDKNIAIVNQKIAQTKTYKKGLLQQMFV
ncbi:restriction endonuclease subunit S [Polaribacter sp. R77954]|uniref:restriction endonuclease subunit S n=1 Tax=Polaribacter sp. R77954 TaxID=3093870 RepID=UPI0037CC9F0C